MSTANLDMQADGTALLRLDSGAALAQQAYPHRPLRMVIPWPPGPATDLVDRVAAQRLT